MRQPLKYRPRRFRRKTTLQKRRVRPSFVNWFIVQNESVVVVSRRGSFDRGKYSSLSCYQPRTFHAASAFFRLSRARMERWGANGKSFGREIRLRNALLYLTTLSRKLGMIRIYRWSCTIHFIDWRFFTWMKSKVTSFREGGRKKKMVGSREEKVKRKLISKAPWRRTWTRLKNTIMHY